MTVDEFISEVKQRLGKRDISRPEIDRISIEILHDPGSVATAYKVTALTPELIAVTEYVIGRVVADYGPPELPGR